MTEVPPNAAERMRLYRKRRRQGLQFVRIPLHVTEIDALIRIGRLKEDSRTDAEVLQAAVLSLVYPWILVDRDQEGVRVTSEGVRDHLPDQGDRLGGGFVTL